MPLIGMERRRAAQEEHKLNSPPLLFPLHCFFVRSFGDKWKWPEIFGNVRLRKRAQWNLATKINSLIWLLALISRRVGGGGESEKNLITWCTTRRSGAKEFSLHLHCITYAWRETAGENLPERALRPRRKIFFTWKMAEEESFAKTLINENFQSIHWLYNFH